MSSDRTKIAMVQAAIQLSKSKSIKDITVSDICRVAQVDRHTFYYHFIDKYDLVAWTYARIYKHDAEGYSLREKERALEKIKSSSDFFIATMHDTSQNSLRKYALDYQFSYYLKLLEDTIGKENVSDDMKVAVKMYCYGSWGAVTDWIDMNFPLSSKQLAKVLEDTLPEFLKTILVKG